jgi:hypothetical protein
MPKIRLWQVRHGSKQTLKPLKKEKYKKIIREQFPALLKKSGKSVDFSQREHVNMVA